MVTKAAFCRACGTEGASSVTGNVGVNDPNVLNSEEWNFGLGHYVVVRYNNNILPASTKQILEQRNLGGAHLFVAYAHLQSMNVSQGTRVQGGAQLGTLGNSGNSTGPHLHLEVRAGRKRERGVPCVSGQPAKPRCVVFALAADGFV